MLDIKFIRENRQSVEKMLKRRNSKVTLGKILELDEKRRSLHTENQQKQAERNRVSKEVGIIKNKTETVLRKMLEIEGSQESFLPVLYRYLRLCFQFNALPIIPVPDKQSRF